ncbi:MAG: hypothetical protein SVU32_02670 [Candidatus Nanohaloarchaea archaeon]|nr:hypothetical protein [Candidatus Nanohaloarchaea archaeon]
MGGTDPVQDLLEKVFNLTSSRGLRMEVEFEDQEVTMGDSSIVLNGKTIVKGEERQ